MYCTTGISSSDFVMEGSKKRFDSSNPFFQRDELGWFFDHDRFGLETPYMTEEWFDSLEFTISEAEKQKVL